MRDSVLNSTKLHTPRYYRNLHTPNDRTQSFVGVRFRNIHVNRWVLTARQEKHALNTKAADNKYHAVLLLKAEKQQMAVNRMTVEEK
ncbi:hypothetical protein CEXT_601481 [Caerostris extrusa]|uniref:Uncharacterized protein n=1 Tax=Caerostris extrusa TaxID=172846 RepID=A0AAV4QEM6_CAEEX|nr:hypothetical protein CEXT_601481 [Caerostris extrusa]